VLRILARLDPSRTDAVDANAVRREADRHRVGQRDD
jgi:hypothetical protein